MSADTTRTVAPVHRRRLQPWQIEVTIDANGHTETRAQVELHETRLDAEESMRRLVAAERAVAWRKGGSVRGTVQRVGSKA